MWRSIAWLLIAIAAAVLLTALLLPATQSAREAANRAPVQGGRASEYSLPHPDFAARNKLAQANADIRSENMSGLPEVAVSETLRGEAKPLPGVDRKIIYSASVDLAVEDFANIQDKIAALVKKYDGYVADSNITGSTGENRHGNWKIRVPVAQFDEFVTAAKGLGELINASTTSKDVSEEYYDVDARIRNKQKEEERLIKLLEDRPGKLEDVIAIERELSRVREEIERMQGRMRVLTDLTALTTTDITISEIHNYKPEDAPTLETRIHRSFDVSWEALVATGANALVVGASIIPWLPLALIALVVLYILIRAARRYDTSLRKPNDQSKA